MRVALIVPYFPPDSNQSALMYGSLADDLAAQGCDVVVVTTQSHYAGIARKTTFKLFSVEKKPNCTIVRVFVPPLNRGSILSRILVTVSYNLLGALWLMFRRKAHVAVVPNPAYLCAGVTIVALVKGARLHYRIHDLYPDIAIRLGLVPSSGIASRILLGMESAACSRADHVTVVTEAFLSTIHGRKVPQYKISVVPDWVDTNAIHPGERMNSFSQRHALDNKCVVMYGGNVGLSQGLEVLLDAGELLRHREDILFLIIGDGAAKRRLVELQQERGLDNVRFLPPQSSDSLNEVYAASDIGFVSLKLDVSPEWCPAKVYTTMASGRPVLAATGVDGSETARVVQKFDCGVCVASGDAAAIARAIVSLADSPETRSRLGARGRVAAERYFSRAVCTRDLFRRLSEAAAVGCSKS